MANTLAWFDDPDPERSLAEYLRQRTDVYNREKLHVMQRLIPKPSAPGAHALDYGCGGGQVAVYLAQLGYEVTACDASPCSLAACRLHLERKGLKDKVKVIESGPPNYWRTLTGPFDLIIAKDVIEHIDDDTAFLRGMSGLLRPGGCLVLSTQNHHSWAYCIQAPHEYASDPHWCGWDPTHVRFYSKPHLAGLLAAAGLAPEAWRSSYLIPYRNFRGIAARLAGGVLRRILGEGVFYWPERLLRMFPPFNGLGWSLFVRAKRKD